MTRKKCLDILKNKKHPEFKELHHVYYTNYNNVKKFFKPLIDDMRKERPGVDIHLHHIEVNNQNYELWDTIVPLYNDEHLEIHHQSKETRKKIGLSNSISLKGRKLSIEHIKNRSKSRIGKPTRLKGQHLSEEHKRKLSEALKGKKRSEEAKRKDSEAKQGDKNPNFGKAPWNKGIKQKDYKKKVA